MSKFVRIENNVVAEIIPNTALPVEKWYGKEFAESCVEAPDEVQERWVYDPTTGTFDEVLGEAVSKPSQEERISALESAMLSLMGVDGLV